MTRSARRRVGRSRVGALPAVVVGLVATLQSASADPLPVEEMEALVCRELAEQTGQASLERAVGKSGWELGAALETASCRYIFVDGGARAPAGHHIVARWRNQELIPWIAEYYRAKADPDGVARVFRRVGRDGDAIAYLDRMIARFEEGDPEMAELFADARSDLREALAPAPPAGGEPD
ncbi:MAG: hypothetical protein AAFU68_10680 [Pseudomonadota bacterium]